MNKAAKEKALELLKNNWGDAIIISLICILLLVCYTFYMKWQKEKNIFVFISYMCIFMFN